MYFKRIEMHGFKSFAEPVTIEFDRGITCVVGPNGSGKSNISDAIRWVLGEQSPRLLRGGKMEDVIFSGTASRKSRGMAEVTLVIDNTSKFLPVDFGEVAITRRMYRSGESEYAINNNPCRMRDIRDLLADTGIGVDGYSLIGQGKISEIISNKKESIREIFEESAGIVSYKNKKSETERKLASTFSNMERVQDIIIEIEDRIGGLEDESKRAKEYLGLKDRYKELEINITVRNIDDIEEKALVFKEDLSEITGDINSLTKVKEEIEEVIGSSNNKVAEIEESLEEKNQNLGEIEKKLREKSGENTVGRERIRALENNQFRLKREISQFKEKLELEKEELLKLEEEKKVLEAEYSEKFSNLDVIEAEETLRNSQVEAIEREIDKEKEELFHMTNSKNIAINEKLSLENLEKNLEIDFETIRAEQSENSLLSMGEDISMAQIEYEKNLEKVEKIKEESIAIQKNRDEVEKELGQLKRRFQNGTLEMEKTLSRRKILEELEDSYEGYNYGVKFIIGRNIKGIHDVVANIIDVPKGLEKAVEIALGTSIQNVVCENEGVAKISIEELKKNKAGRVTFLPITTIEPRNNRREEEIEKIAGFIGYGDHKVKVEKKYQNILSHLLGGTVITEDMDSAIKMQKISKKYRYVTKNGEVVAGTGAISGGEYKTRGNNILERKKEIGKLKEKIVNFEKELANINKGINRLSGDLQDANSLIESKNKELEKAQLEATVIKEELDSLKVRHEILSHEEEKRNDRRKELIERKEGVKKSIEKKREEIEEIDIKTKEIMRTLDEKMAVLDNLKKIQKEKATSLVEMRIKSGDIRSQLSSIDNIILRNTQIIKEIEDDIENRAGEIDSLVADKEGITKGIQSRNEEVARLNGDKSRLSHEINSQRGEIAMQKKLYHESIEKREEVSGKLERLKSQKYELDLRLAKFETQLENLKNKIWDEFEISYLEAIEMRDDTISINSAAKENREIKNKIKALGDINVGSIKEYEEVKTRYDFLIEQRNDIETSANQLKSIIREMDGIIKSKFQSSFNSIGSHFEEIFAEFFGGGVAKLEIDNIDDPLNSTIEITAQPPGKQLKNINLLSGGEKTMTAIALMFAVLKTKPTPCCILDEVEAALDDNNIHIFANYLKRFENVQFTLITHQKTTMEHADVMYGVTMPERGISKIFSLSMGEELPTN